MKLPKQGEKWLGVENNQSLPQAKKKKMFRKGCLLLTACFYVRILNSLQEGGKIKVRWMVKDWEFEELSGKGK